ncbi:MAG: hypothetical protein D6732_20725 [Methanobacteriota archaeon]|nr:MAG: hypothetical protein D6732_20725 [Euryarchaeota archaeon]
MERTLQRFDFSGIPTKDGYSLNLSGIVSRLEGLNGSFERLQNIFSNFFSRYDLMDLLPIIEERNETGLVLTNEIKTKCQEEGLPVKELKIIILSTSRNGLVSSSGGSSQKFDTKQLENMTVKKKKSIFSKLFRR